MLFLMGLTKLAGQDIINTKAKKGTQCVQAMIIAMQEMKVGVLLESTSGVVGNELDCE